MTPDYLLVRQDDAEHRVPPLVSPSGDVGLWRTRVRGEPFPLRPAPGDLAEREDPWGGLPLDRFARARIAEAAALDPPLATRLELSALGGCGCCAGGCSTRWGTARSTPSWPSGCTTRAARSVAVPAGAADLLERVVFIDVVPL
ncbi:hypothetical protein [Spongiactinospora sp. TRM90649]|uniref:hypothetical protein n=1 Tax=Spongiactinospora sp. TRM90649 TaxID=3031114 RepID=UPI0023F80FF4|nr:hypothetical protein [Spongiactinospora sp. TRM90649]MDF5755593.1 hypothetical protein [Spongiactinospora sp. TRM90649]